MVIFSVLEDVTATESTDFDPGYMGEHPPDADLLGGHVVGNPNESNIYRIHNTIYMHR